ncbi:uncharacterized protein LOC125179242 [Hyalella azteca]|uniref:Uncharacterized protein LOC125179242 n=1 Tax=Hyalella azteca TaxID=294128 RepID=A0A979FVX8_HYAAZ|nr:uncharacterized protein LOC125179242 [Hyalella azteca]
MDASQIGGAVGVVLFVIVFVVVGASFGKTRIRARKGNGGANIRSMDAVADSRDGFREALTRREIINRDFQPYVDASSAPATKITQTLSPFPVNHCNVNRLYPESKHEQEYENTKNLYPVGSDGYVIMNSWEETRNLYANEIGNSHI